MPTQTRTDPQPSPRRAELTDLAEELGEATRRLRRATRRSVALASSSPALPMSQVEVLQVVAEHPGSGVGDVAESLSLAVNTVSTIVGQLVAAGLLRRERGRVDRRTAELHLSPEAHDRLAGWRRRRGEVVADALGQLAPGELRRLAAGLPALRQLAAALERS